MDNKSMFAELIKRIEGAKLKPIAIKATVKAK